ncbi:ATP-grasp domain-containing protein [Nesterenkonia salmonea]|uniref:ATP-grasp domain-containing protein n=1 Tax=Nesterenkonia salmonea TaxID=1804987 RepID=A0A5R9BC32_9MICC|nr:ATP-grasp domain-containing protein [Nesterenkonia salmonea]
MRGVGVIVVVIDGLLRCGTVPMDGALPEGSKQGRTGSPLAWLARWQIPPYLLALGTDRPSPSAANRRRNHAIYRCDSHTNGPTAHESDLGSTVVGDKALTAELLRSHGVSTPRTVVVSSAEEAVEAARTIDGPVVIKPQDGSQGRGVSTDLVLEKDIRRAFTFARKYRDGVIVQEHIEVGEEMRVMASSDRVVAANVRVFPHVVGDGVSTIEQLIKDKNLQRASSTIFGQAPIPIDRITRQFLRRHGLRVESVPPLGETVTVRNVGGHSVGADIKQDIDNASEDVKDTARQAIAAIPGLAWGGVDIITDVKTGKAYVIEVNTNAGFLSAAFPTYGQPKDVTQDIFQLRYDDTSTEPARDAPVKLPAAASRPQAFLPTQGLGNQQSSTVGELIHRSWLKQGLSVGRLTDKLSKVTTHSGERLWVTAEGRTSKDRFVVRRVVRRHPLLFRFLEQESVPMVRGRSVSTTD